MTLPNFVIIGAMKSGTGSLNHALGQHPQVFLPDEKEIHFFGKAYTASSPTQYPKATTLAEYEAHFAGVTDEIAIGDASMSYMHNPQAIDDIARTIPQARLIAMLRNPVDRAHSHYWHERNRYREPIADFEEAFWHYSGFDSYRDRSLYAAYLQPYFDRFGPEQVRVWIYDDYRADPGKVLAEIFAFLGVDATFVPEQTQSLGKTGEPRSELLQQALRKPNVVRRVAQVVLPRAVQSRIKATLVNANLKPRPKVSAQTRQSLSAFFREDIEQLQQLLGRSLEHWLA